MFVGAGGDSAPSQYVELEVSPRNVMFQASITNTLGECGKFASQFLDCDTSGIVSRVDHTSNGWNVTLTVPFSVIPGNGGNLFANFFRIDMINSNSQRQEFQALNPTFKVKRPPRFCSEASQISPTGCSPTRTLLASMYLAAFSQFR